MILLPKRKEGEKCPKGKGKVKKQDLGKGMMLMC